jgi:hypothetical protein
MEKERIIMNFREMSPWKHIKLIIMVMVMGNTMFFMTGCVSPQKSTTTPTTSTTKKQDLFEKAPVRSNEYESPDILRASEVLPPELLEGKNYNVHEDVLTYGFTNYYTIMSPLGTFEAEGDDMVRTRIHEIKAIAALQEIKKSNAFGEAAKKAATSSVKGAWSLISQPVKTVSGVPKGVGRLFSRVSEMVKGDRGDSEDSVAKELIGFSRVKRQYAYKMGVDVYSSNEVLQRELNSVSWAGFAGGVGISLATRAVKGASELAYFSIKGTKFIYGMNKIILDNAPEDLRRINREKLLQMGIEESVIEEFLRNPNFSPRHETILVHALSGMEGVRNRDQFIKQAYFAESELDASTFQRIAEMLHGYHTQVGPISEIIPVRRVAVGYTSDQILVIALPADYIYWTERADLGLDAVMRLQAIERPVKRVELWVTGKISQKARKEFEAKGLVVKEQIGDELMPPSS